MSTTAQLRAVAVGLIVRANANRDPDLELLRGSGRLAAILTG